MPVEVLSVLVFAFVLILLLRRPIKRAAHNWFTPEPLDDKALSDVIAREKERTKDD